MKDPGLKIPYLNILQVEHVCCERITRMHLESLDHKSDYSNSLMTFSGRELETVQIDKNGAFVSEILIRLKECLLESTKIVETERRALWIDLPRR
jgi:hypothetical protein